MARKNDTPQKAAMRELMNGYLKQNNVKIKDSTDVNAIMLDIPGIRIIIQAKGKTQKMDLPFVTINLSYFSFFEFTQTLKRSPKSFLL